MCPPGVVGCASMCELVVHSGGSAEGGIDTRRVVEVPSDRMASPGEESDTIEDGLSPVNGATMQSTIKSV